MLSKSKLKFLKSLNQKKFRDIHGIFSVEGPKLIQELLASDYKIHSLFYSGSVDDFNFEIPVNAEQVSEKELAALSSFKTPNRIIAFAEMQKEMSTGNNTTGLRILLDDISDPGNLGTIIRLADWYGIKGVICSENSVDKYNPKVIQASMGSIFRIPVYYTSLVDYVNSLPKDSAVLLADMVGESIYKTDFPENLNLIMGSESHGISENLRGLVENRITIPKIGNAESLNVAMAAGIICSEIFRHRV